MQSAQPIGLPTGAFPATDRVAIDEPYTKMWFDLVVRASKRGQVSLVITVIALLIFSVTATQSLGRDDFGVLVLVVFGLLAVLNGVAVLVNGRTRAVAESVYPRYPWHAVAATMVSDRPFVAAVQLGPDRVHLSLRRAQPVTRQVVLRSGRLWLCGPDERGRVMARVDGLSFGVPARILDQPPADATPPVLTEPTGPRPLDEPMLAGLLRRQLRLGLVRYLGPAIVLALGVASVVVSPVYAAVGPIFLVLAVVYAVLAGLAVTRFQGILRQSSRLLADAPGWTPVLARLDSWQAAGRVIGPARGQVWLPDGSTATVSVPRAGIDLVANIQASGTLWVAGPPTRGSTMAVGLPGYPLLGLATIE
ncbi:MAG TPA: hypothetical protein VHW44_03425 [Pseudonocardiaceae bacterium]|jgi:hypothetical protein|nr:hypothetical protein [Pseudonocardiaceae bacterium]